MLRPVIVAARGRGTSKYSIPILSDTEGEDSIKADSDWTADEEHVASQYNTPAAIVVGDTPGQLLLFSHTILLTNALLP